MRHQHTKESLLQEMSTYLYRGLASDEILSKAVTVKSGRLVPGPRAGAVELYVGTSAPQVLTALSKKDCALARQFIPWEFTGDPQVRMRGRYIRIEAGWPRDLEEADVSIAEASQAAKKDGAWRKQGGRTILRNPNRWVVGKDEWGRVVTAGLSADYTPHYLIAGGTGSGKTVAAQSAVIQLSAHEENLIVLIDGKMGADWRGTQFLPYSLENLGRLVGPIATTPEQWQAAAIWASNQLSDRMSGNNDDRNLIVVVDEIQAVLDGSPDVVNEAIKRIAQIGRSGHVHLITLTQHPVNDNLGGSSVARNLIGKLVLRVDNFDASRVALGASEPRADKLLGRGDGITSTPHYQTRVQVAYPEVEDAEAVSSPRKVYFEEWPLMTAEDIGQAPSAPGNKKPFTGEEIGVSLLSASQGNGRPTMRDMLQDMTGGSTGGNRARRLLKLGRDTYDFLREHGYGICDRHEVDC